MSLLIFCFEILNDLVQDYRKHRITINKIHPYDNN